MTGQTLQVLRIGVDVLDAEFRNVTAIGELQVVELVADERLDRGVGQAAVGDLDVLEPGGRQILEDGEEAIVVLGSLAALRVLDNLVAYLAREGNPLAQHAVAALPLYRDNVEILADEFVAQIGQPLRAYILIRVKQVIQLRHSRGSSHADRTESRPGHVHEGKTRGLHVALLGGQITQLSADRLRGNVRADQLGTRDMTRQRRTAAYESSADRIRPARTGLTGRSAPRPAASLALSRRRRSARAGRPRGTTHAAAAAAAAAGDCW